MKHTWIYNHPKEQAIFTNPKKVTVESDADDLQELLDEFKMYLQSCGYIFKIDEYISVVGEDE